MNLYLIHLSPAWVINLFESLWMGVAAGTLLLFVLFWVLLVYISKKYSKPVPIPEKEKGNLNYDDLLETINKQNGRFRSLLFAANCLDDLPVTIPVNVAIRLAQTHTCLLVDLDTKRNAISQVFDLDTAAENTTFEINSCTTQVQNLLVWPARNFERLKQMNFRSLLEAAFKKYDYVLIYAPYLTTLPDRQQIATCAKQAIAFTGNDRSRLMQLLEQCNCKVVKEI